jgi:hypothetical protein
LALIKITIGNDVDLEEALVEEGVTKLKVIVHETHEEPSSPTSSLSSHPSVSSPSPQSSPTLAPSSFASMSSIGSFSESDQVLEEEAAVLSAVVPAAAAAQMAEDLSPEEEAFADFLVSIEVPKIYTEVRKKRNSVSNTLCVL